MLFPLIVSAISLVLSGSPVFAITFDDDGYGSAKYYAEQDRAHERQMQEYRAEEEATQYRNAQAAERLNNEPTRYDSPSYEPSTRSFTFSSGNDPQDMKLCTSSRTGGVSCY